MGCGAIGSMPTNMSARNAFASPQQQNQAQQKQQQEELRKHDDELEAKVIAHENAHAAIAGNAPVYEYNARGKIVGGHVPVSFSANDRASLERAKAAAAAPGGDMSGQDAAVYAQADALLRSLDAKANMGKAQLGLQNKKAG
jgi:hypothetical protein